MDKVDTMDKRSLAEQFYIDDHALIYGLLGKYAEECCGEKGMDALAKATVQYARERGLRMAKRCLADGRELSMQSYLLYAEWADTRGWTGIEVSGIVHRFLNHVEKCAWHIAWKQYDLMRYGAVYCTWVDKNLVKGFNPENEVVIDSVLTHGAASCEFDWLGANFQTEQEFYELMAKKKELAPRTVKDFLYHTAHILSALRRVFYVELGVPATEEICKKAFEEYTAIMGADKLSALLEEAKLDFFEI